MKILKLLKKLIVFGITNVVKVHSWGTLIKKLRKLHWLLKEFKNSEYRFTLSEKALGIKLNLFGYRNKPDEKIISLGNGKMHMKVGDYELYVSENTFKPGEIAHLYSESLAPSRENPHAYEMGDLQIKKDDYIIDGGACEGFFSKYALQREAKMVFIFEPLGRLFNDLKLTFKQETEANKVMLFKEALYKESGTTRFGTKDEYIWAAKMSQSGIEECKTVSIDEMLESGIIPAVNFIKLDIEGSEVFAIEGAKKTIKKHKPKLSIAVYHHYNNAKIIGNLILGYRPDYRVSFGGCYMFEKPYRPFMIYAW